MRTLFVLILLVNFCAFSHSAMPLASNDSRWWPTQAVPKALVRTRPSGASIDMMVQSIAGLAAKAVNDGRGDEMIWVTTGSVDVEDWFARLLKRQPSLAVRGTFDPWNLVDRYARRGIIKGYI